MTDLLDRLIEGDAKRHEKLAFRNAVRSLSRRRDFLRGELRAFSSYPGRSYDLAERRALDVVLGLADEIQRKRREDADA